MDNSSVLKTQIGKLVLKNPVMPASGTFSMDTYKSFFDLDTLGALVLKTVTLAPRQGNGTPRVAEVYGGMLNCVGLQNPGLDVFMEQELPKAANLATPLIISIAGSSLQEYVSIAERISQCPQVAALEVNISCPNVNNTGKVFCDNRQDLHQLVTALREVTRQNLIIKLSPNKCDISEMAVVCEQAGADMICVANTFVGMKIDIESQKPLLSNKVGGMSGPAIKPIILNMVYQIYEKVKIPIIGVGGISTAEDALEYMMAGATAIQVGTASFVNPHTMPTIIDGLMDYAQRQGLSRLQDIVGIAHC